LLSAAFSPGEGDVGILGLGMGRSFNYGTARPLHVR
jgi:hypothetical protein